eukprot:6492735-Amphidinium_carterae.2
MRRHVGFPLEEYVSRSQTLSSTPAGSKAYWVSVATSGLSELVYAQLQHFTSFEFAQHMDLGSTSNLYAERLHALEGRITSRLWTAELRLCAELALTSLHLQLPPLSFLCLLTDEPASRMAEVSRAKTAWEAYERLEATAKTNTEAAELLRDAMVPGSQLSMELFLRLREARM